MGALIDEGAEIHGGVQRECGRVGEEDGGVSGQFLDKVRIDVEDFSEPLCALAGIIGDEGDGLTECGQEAGFGIRMGFEPFRTCDDPDVVGPAEKLAVPFLEKLIKLGLAEDDAINEVLLKGGGLFCGGDIDERHVGSRRKPCFFERNFRLMVSDCRREAHGRRVWASSAPNGSSNRRTRESPV